MKPFYIITLRVYDKLTPTKNFDAKPTMNIDGDLGKRRRRRRKNKNLNANLHANIYIYINKMRKEGKIPIISDRNHQMHAPNI